MKRIISLILIFVMMAGMLPRVVLASQIEAEENLWEGKHAVFVGDSITAGSGTTKKYYEYLEQDLGFGSVTGMGVGGSCISAASDYGTGNQPLINRYQNIPSLDLIVIFMGTNDYGHETPLGTVADTKDGTFYGALNVIVPALVAKHTSSKIVFVTPLHRYGFGTSKILGTKFTYDNIPNGVGATLGDYVQALKTVCANNGVSVIDLHTECTLDPSDAEVRSTYMPDGIHPNAAGHEVIAGILKSHIQGYVPPEKAPESETEMIYGNKFAAGFLQENRASARLNQYLKAGTVITLKDPAAMQWSCAKTSDAYSNNNLGYFPDSAWTDKETAIVEQDGWVGFVFKYRDETLSFDLSKPLSDYITIVEPHTHEYQNGICTVCGMGHPNLEKYKGKVISVLGDSISTFAGYIPTADGFNLEHLARYPQDNLLTDVNETWWMQIVHLLDAKLGINDSWRGATVSGAAPVTTGTTGENAAMHNLIRIQNLGSNGTPDVILFYGGTNDLAHVSKVGTFDAASAPTEVDLTTKKWDNLADGYVHTLLRLKHFYPEAQIICLLPAYASSYYSNTKLEQGNAVLAAICQHYDVAYVDLRSCGITTAQLPDGIHPDAEGMDFITNAVLDLMLTECELESGEHIVHSVTHALTGAESSKAYYQGVSDGNRLVTTITGEDVSVTVVMGGKDITSECYADGVVDILAVTGDVVITAQGKKKVIYADYLQQLPDALCGKTNIWSCLEHNKEYYTATGWGVHASGKVYSITIPISAGDQIWATSFQSSGLNGSTVNGIRLTWFNAEGVLNSVSPEAVYDEFTKNGYLSAPETAVAVNVVMWNNDADNEVYIRNRDHIYENGSCTACGEAVPGAMIGSTHYTLEKALEIAKEGDTIVLTADGAIEEIYLRKGRILDLNGCKLTVTGELTAANKATHIKDSTNGKGVLAVEQENIALNVFNAYLPVWVEGEGFHFVKHSFTTRIRTATTHPNAGLREEAVQFRFWLDGKIDCLLAQQLADGGADNLIKVKVKMNWVNSAGQACEQFFTFADDTVSQYATYKDAEYNWETNVLILTVNGARDVQGLVLTAELVYDDLMQLASDAHVS